MATSQIDSCVSESSSVACSSHVLRMNNVGDILTCAYSDIAPQGTEKFLLVTASLSILEKWIYSAASAGAVAVSLIIMAVSISLRISDRGDMRAQRRRTFFVRRFCFCLFV